jgi:hypothetical protein
LISITYYRVRVINPLGYSLTVPHTSGSGAFLPAALVKRVYTVETGLRGVLSGTVITSIGMALFTGCVNLQQVDMITNKMITNSNPTLSTSQVRYASYLESAFQGCSALEEFPQIELTPTPAYIYSNQNRAFYSAFEGCVNMKNTYSRSLPDCGRGGANTTGGGNMSRTFYNCPKLTNIVSLFANTVRQSTTGSTELQRTFALPQSANGGDSTESAVDIVRAIMKTAEGAANPSPGSYRRYMFEYRTNITGLSDIAANWN